jgi:hypothetical protein
MVAHSGVLYREVFPNRPTTSTLSQENNLYANGWFGGNSGDGFQVGQGSGEGGISTGNTGAAELAAVNSNPLGGTAPSSFGFFSKTGVSNNFFYTAEYSVASTALLSFDWNSRNVTHTGNLTPFGQGSAAETAMHLVLQIGANWYLSQTGVVQVGDGTAWRSNSLAMSGLNWAQCTNGAAGLLPSCSLAGSFGVLPTGNVTAFGLWWLRGAGTYRIDNFTINGTVPAPGTWGLVGLALGAMALARRRQRGQRR